MDARNVNEIEQEWTKISLFSFMRNRVTVLDIHAIHLKLFLGTRTFPWKNHPSLLLGGVDSVPRSRGENIIQAGVIIA